MKKLKMTLTITSIIISSIGVYSNIIFADKYYRSSSPIPGDNHLGLIPDCSVEIQTTPCFEVVDHQCIKTIAYFPPGSAIPIAVEFRISRKVNGTGECLPLRRPF